MPAGVKYAVANECGTEWVTGMNWQSKGPIRRRSPSAHGNELGAVEHPRFLDAVAGEAERELRAVDRDGDVAQEVGEPAGVVLVRVGEHDALDPVGVLAEVREVGQDEVDAGHVGLGEHEPAVDDEDAPLDLEAEAVPADLAQPAEEDEPHCARSPG